MGRYGDLHHTDAYMYIAIHRKTGVHLLQTSLNLKRTRSMMSMSQSLILYAFKWPKSQQMDMLCCAFGQEDEDKSVENMSDQEAEDEEIDVVTVEAVPALLSR